MTYISVTDYIKRRESYNYTDNKVQFEIIQTGCLCYVGKFKGIYSSIIPEGHSNGINLRILEILCREVFEDCCKAYSSGKWSINHLSNLKNITCAIVHWKLASQGFRAEKNVNNVLSKWTSKTHEQLLEAYLNEDLIKFRIGGVRIPIATAFLRFLYPDRYGIMDKRVVNNHTQPQNKTTLNLRKEDGYINDLTENIEKYYSEYIPFLRSEADDINNSGLTFNEDDHNWKRSQYKFRPCDVEMSLFV